MFFPKRHRYYRALFCLIVAELPLTVVVLILTGIASHDLYRTSLWQDGADNGFNSSPNQMVYAAANYQPYKTPIVWSSFITNYNLVIGVLSVFLLITKFPMMILKLFYPPICVAVNGCCFALYIVAARFQAGSDMSDPQHPQPGPPWYITKNCHVAAHKSNIGFCQQAKALFLICIFVSAVYFAELVLGAISCFSTKEERDEYRERREEKRAVKAYEDSLLKSPGMIPLTPAPFTGTSAGFGMGMAPVTPRTLAFNRLGGTTSSDLPLRTHDSGPIQQEFDFNLASGVQQPAQAQLYFPPPPKKAVK